MRQRYSTDDLARSQERIDEFVERHSIPDLGSRTALFCLASRCVLPDGMLLEFGVGHGHTIRELGKLFGPRSIFGFDSFEGLPEDGPDGRFDKGTFALPDGPPEVPVNASLVVGLFQNTLNGFLVGPDAEGALAFAHIDSDLYSSAKYVLRTLGDFDVWRPGSLIQFDEYLEPWFWPEGEHTAFQEFLQHTGWSCEYLGRHQGHLLVRLGYVE